MTTITDPRSGVTTLVKKCNVCPASIYFGYSEKGRRCPYDVVDGVPTRTSHFTTCPAVGMWKEKHPK